jgi:hypothetical protein
VPRPKLFDVEIKTGLTAKTHGELQRLAQRDATTVSDLIRHAIKRYLRERSEEGE